jgi:hypothetical protein
MRRHFLGETMTRKQITSLPLFVTSLALLCAASPIAIAQSGSGKNGGGGGGGGTQSFPLTHIGGNYSGTVASGAPVISLRATMSLTEDLVGNLSGTICIQECNTLSGKASASPFFPYGVFQFKAGDDQFSGIVEGPVTCGDGTTGMWIAGSFQNRGATSTFSVTTCQQQ